MRVSKKRNISKCPLSDATRERGETVRMGKTSQRGRRTSNAGSDGSRGRGLGRREGPTHERGYVVEAATVARDMSHRFHIRLLVLAPDLGAPASAARRDTHSRNGAREKHIFSCRRF